MSYKISSHIAYKEVIRSQTAVRKNINNTPGAQQLHNIRTLASKVFEPLRAMASQERGQDTAIHISSFFRSTELNTAIGGSERSQHCKGEAMDLDIDGRYDDMDNADLFYMIEEELEFDQLIWEYGDDENPDWVHVSYREGNNRKRILRAIQRNGKVNYEEF